MTRLIKFLLIGLIFFFDFIPAYGQQSQINEQGLIPVFNYSVDENNGFPQNWAIIQDKQGIIYIGNNQGVLQYDGANWTLIKVPNETNVRSLAIDEKGRIYVGSSGEFGFLKADSIGKMKYISLLKYVNKEKQNFKDVWCAVNTPNATYFMTDEILFKWDGHKITLFNAEKTFHRIFYLNGHLFVRQKEVGLMELVNDKLILLKGGEMFSEERIYGMDYVDKDSYYGEKYFIVTKNKGAGIITYNSSNKSIAIKYFDSDLNNLLRKNIPYTLCKVGSYYYIGTITNAVYISDSLGNLEGILNQSNTCSITHLINASGNMLLRITDEGLQDGTIYSQFLDNKNNLWLGLSNGISKIPISPFSLFSYKNGLKGGVQDVKRFNNQLFIASSNGLGVLKPSGIRDTAFFPANIEDVGNLGECWSLVPFYYKNYSTLLAVSSSSVLSISKEQKINSIGKYKAWKLYRSKIDSARVFVGLDSGLATIYWSGKNWIDEGMVHGISEWIQSITEDNEGNAWLGSENTAVKLNKNYFLNKSSTLITKYDSSSGLPTGSIYVENVGGEILFGTSKGLFKMKSNKMEHEGSYGKFLIDTNSHIHRIVYDERTKNVWFELYHNNDNSFELGYLEKRNNEYVWNKNQFISIYSKAAIQSIFPENGTVWFGGGNGLFKYELANDKKNPIVYFSNVRKITSLKDSSVIFNWAIPDSTSMNQIQHLIINYSNNSVMFEFAAADFQDEYLTVYSYYLEGLEKSWNKWDKARNAKYTNLSEGDYIFCLKAKNLYGQESKEYALHITVKPPWYRTWLAYSVYIFLLILFIWFIVNLSGKGLKRVIDQRTAEVVEQKKIIEEKQKDIIDSINYAKRIQQSQLPTEKYIDKCLKRLRKS